MLKIDFKYKLRDQDSWVRLPMSPEEYFDHEEGEIIDLDSYPEYTNLLEYISADRDRVIAASVKAEDISDEKRFETYDQIFWNQQRNSMMVITQHRNGNCNTEFILESLIKDKQDEMIWEIIRIEKDGDSLKPVLHTFIAEDQNGLLYENKMDL